MMTHIPGGDKPAGVPFEQFTPTPAGTVGAPAPACGCGDHEHHAHGAGTSGAVAPPKLTTKPERRCPACKGRPGECVRDCTERRKKRRRTRAKQTLAREAHKLAALLRKQPGLLGKLIDHYIFLSRENHLKRDAAWEILGRHLGTAEARTAFDRAWEQREREARQFCERFEQEQRERAYWERWQRWAPMWAGFIGDIAAAARFADAPNVRELLATAAVLTALGGGVNHLEGRAGYDSAEQLLEYLSDLGKLPLFGNNPVTISTHFNRARDVLRLFAGRGFYTEQAGEAPPDLTARVSAISAEGRFPDLVGWMGEALRRRLNLATIEAAFGSRIDEEAAWWTWAESGRGKDAKEFQTFLDRLAARRQVNLALVLAMVEAGPQAATVAPAARWDFSDLGGEPTAADLADRERRRQEAEQAAAAYAAELERQAAYRCTDPRGVLLRHSHKTKARTIAGRCGRCDGCRRLLVERNMANVRLRLGRLEHVHTTSIDATAWETWRRRLNRAGVNHFAVPFKYPGIPQLKMLVVADGRFPGCDMNPTPTAEILQRFEELLPASLDFARQRWRPISASPAWALPRLQKVKAKEWKRVGKMSSIDREVIQKIAEHHRMRATPSSGRRTPQIVWDWTFAPADPWQPLTPEQFEAFLADLQAGEILSDIDIGTGRDGPSRAGPALQQPAYRATG
jgi:hypothetical protein